VSAGYGFHSNDARGVTAPTDSADPLARSYGGEVGLRSTAISNLQSTLSLFWLDIDSELIFVGDAGNTEASRPSRRTGIEIANYYTPTEWLTIDLDLSLSKARFRDSDIAGKDIPGSVERVIASGISVHDLGPWFGELRMRSFGSRALIEDGSVSSDPTMLVSARVGYELSSRWTVSAEIFNLLNREDSEIDYFYASRLAGESEGPDEGGTNDIHRHPTDPISLRLSLTARF
jgi:outer membrane receptor protein involved in Fe transport